MTHKVIQNQNGTYQVIDQNGDIYMTGIVYEGRAQIICADLDSQPQPETPEQEHALALKGIPTTKGLKNVEGRLAAIKRAEEIENGD